MKLQGQQAFDAPRDVVWKALNDPEILARTLPGCERLEEKEPQVYAGALNIKVGPVSGQFQGTVKLSDLEENRSYRLQLNGQGAPGFVQGQGSVRLEDRDGGGTMLRYDLDAQVGGRIAGVGQRLLDSSAKVVTRQALEGLEAQIAASYAEPASGSDTQDDDVAHQATGKATADPATAGPATAGPATAGKATAGKAAAPPLAAARPAPPSQAQFAARLAKGVFEELVPAGWRPVVIGGAALLLLAIVFLIVRACSG